MDREAAGAILVELVRTLRLFRATGQHQGHQSISGTKVGVLQYLMHCDVRSSELAHRLLLSPSVVSRAVDALEEEGLVTRRTDPTDARAALISATPRGKEELAQRHRFIADQFAEILSRDPDHATADTLALLRQLNNHLDELATIVASGEKRETDI